MKQSPSPDQWQTIPILPCVSIEETLSFWRSLGYEITYKQVSPYQYGVVQRNGFQLHFARLKGMEAATNSYTGCLVVVNNAREVFQSLAGNLKYTYGKIPHTGIPRISRMKPGASRFTLTDVSGNAIIFVSRGNQDQETWELADNKTHDRLQKAIAVAMRFRDYKNDDEAAAKTLDAALKFATPDNPHLAEALVMRIELSLHEGKYTFAKECQERLASLGVDEHILAALEQKHKSE